MNPKTSSGHSTPQRSRPHIFTLGYEGRTLPEFLALLVRERISAVIDIRHRAASRKRGFSKTPLTDALAKKKIAYFHLPQLGVPPETRHRYEREKDFGILHAYLEEPLERYDVLLLEILEQFPDQNACLLCFEEDFTRCHRSIVADHLSRRHGFEIHHL
jgi:uncharacterized protein (DUF488 family)